MKKKILIPLLAILSLLTIIAVLVFVFRPQEEIGAEPMSPFPYELGRSTNIQTTEITVWGMSCGACANAVSNILLAVNGVTNISVDLRTDVVTIEHNLALDMDEIKNAIEAQGFNMP
ncbi:MAG: heavy-metal-associated domain-containing protein [Pseudomonadales bacterium]|nr:heavy-metal-associated domain-containing protein [Pseudomonadales bacterium]